MSTENEYKYLENIYINKQYNIDPSYLRNIIYLFGRSHFTPIWSSGIQL